MNTASPTSAPSQRLFDRNFVLLFFGAMLFNMNYNGYFLLPYYLELRGTTESFYGSVAGSFGLATFASVVLLGHLGDASKRKWLVAAYMVPFLVGNAIAIAAYRAAPEWYFAVRILQGITSGLGFPLVYAWAVELGPADRKTEVLAYMGIGFVFAAYAGPFVSEMILNVQANPNHPDAFLPVFITMQVIALVALVLFLLVPHSQMAPAGAPSFVAQLRLLSRQATWLMLAITAVFGGAFGMFFAFGKNYAASLGLAYASVLFAGYGIGSVLTRATIRPLVQWLGTPTMISLALTGYALSYLLLGLSQGYVLLGVCGIVAGVSHGLLGPTSTARLFELQRPEEMGRSAILYHGFFGGGAGLFPYIGGYLLEVMDFRLLYHIMGAVCLLSVLLNVWVNRAAPAQLARLGAMGPSTTPAPQTRATVTSGAMGDPLPAMAQSGAAPHAAWRSLGISRVLLLRRSGR